MKPHAFPLSCHTVSSSPQWRSWQATTDALECSTSECFICSCSAHHHQKDDDDDEAANSYCDASGRVGGRHF
eukprot:40800-Eustigmatos_ZCMA.PRE.1